MDELLSEKEQIDRMRSWWSDNGAYIIVGAIIGIGGIFGLNHWRSSQLDMQVGASNLFEALAEEIAENRLDPAEALAADMYADYAGTVYADQSRLAMARLYMDQGRDRDAAAELEALLAGDGNAEMQMVGRLRLAKILLFQDKPEAVLELLEGHTDTGMGPRYNEAIGDAHAELGAYEAAEEAYMAALTDPLAAQLVDTALLQMKISDLPDVVPEGESPPADEAAQAEDDAAAESAEPESDAEPDPATPDEEETVE